MINERYAKDYCCEDFSLIENYEKASKDLIEVWHLHHRKEDEGFSRQELKNAGLYYKRPACELIFLTKSEHLSLHKKGNKNFLGKHHSEESKRKLSDANKGEKNHMYGKRHSEEWKMKMSENSPKSKKVLQINKTTGEIIRTWPRVSEVERQLGISHSIISRCCSGKCKSAGGFFWRYEQ